MCTKACALGKGGGAGERVCVHQSVGGWGEGEFERLFTKSSPPTHMHVRYMYMHVACMLGLLATYQGWTYL